MAREYTPIAVAFELPSGKRLVEEFTDLRSVDKIISPRSRVLPEGSTILEIGVGSKFKDIYIKKYIK